MRLRDYLSEHHPVVPKWIFFDILTRFFPRTTTQWAFKAGMAVGSGLTIPVGRERAEQPAGTGTGVMLLLEEYIDGPLPPDMVAGGVAGMNDDFAKYFLMCTQTMKFRTKDSADRARLEALEQALIEKGVAV